MPRVVSHSFMYPFSPILPFPSILTLLKHSLSNIVHSWVMGKQKQFKPPFLFYFFPKPLWDSLFPDAGTHVSEISRNHLVEKMDIPHSFLRNFRKKFLLMEEKLARVLRRIKATELADTHLKLVTGKLTAIVTASDANAFPPNHRSSIKNVFSLGFFFDSFHFVCSFFFGSGHQHPGFFFWSTPLFFLY